jgi:hypothetical protein
MSSPIEQMVKLLSLLSSDFDHEVLAAARKANMLLVNQDWTWPALLSAGSASALTEEQLQRVFSAGLAKGEASGYQRAMNDVEALGGMTPKAAAAKPVEIGDEIVWLTRILEAAAKAEAAGHLNSWEADFVASRRSAVAQYGRTTFVSPRQRDSLNRLEHSLRRRGYL